MSDTAFDKMLDSLIDEAIPAACSVPDKDLPEEMDVDFSPEFEERIQKLFKNERRKERRKKLLRYSRNAAACFIVFVVVLSVSLMSVEAFRVKFLNLVYSGNKTRTVMSFETPISNRYESDNVILEYVPEGFSLKQSKMAGQLLYLNFDNGDEYFDMDLCGAGTVLAIDSENGSVEEVTINGMDGLYGESDAVKSVVFAIDDRACTIQGTIEKEENIRIAQNLKLK